MADKTSLADYQASGHYEASMTPALEQQAATIKTDDASLQQEAAQQYKPTYDQTLQSYDKQLSALVTSQATDEALLQKQYQTSVSSMARQLQKRGLATPTYIGAQTNALNQYANKIQTTHAAIADSNKQAIQAQRQSVVDNYDNSVLSRVAANRYTKQKTLTGLLESLAQLKASSYADYINYLLAKKGRSGGGGGGGYSYGGSGSGSSSAVSSTNDADISALKGNSTYAVRVKVGLGAGQKSGVTGTRTVSAKSSSSASSTFNAIMSSIAAVKKATTKK